MLSFLELKLWLKKIFLNVATEVTAPTFTQFVFILAVIAYTNSTSKFHEDLGFSILEKGKEILWVHTQKGEKEKKSPNIATKYYVQHVPGCALCLLHNASNSRHLGDLHQIPCRLSRTLCQCSYRSTADWILERNTKRDWLMERHCLFYFEFCISYFSSAKMQ